MIHDLDFGIYRGFQRSVVLVGFFISSLVFINSERLCKYFYTQCSVLTKWNERSLVSNKTETRLSLSFCRYYRISYSYYDYACYRYHKNHIIKSISLIYLFTYLSILPFLSEINLNLTYKTPFNFTSTFFLMNHDGNK